MRVLFAFVGNIGHAEPLVPFARAAAEAGHAVLFTGSGAVVPGLAARGFDVVATSPAEVDVGERRPLVPYDSEHEYHVLRDYYAGRLARLRAAEVRALAAEWLPDVVVGDEVDFGTIVAAERLGVPCAPVLVTVAGSFVRAEVVAPELDAVRAEHGLAPDPELAAPARHLVISPVPPSFRDPGFPLPATGRSFAPGHAVDGELPDRLADLEDAVYVTLGTIFNLESGDLLERVLAGVAEVPRDVVVTVGRQLDPDDFGSVPTNVRLERFVPQAALLPRCAAVVSHAGSGSVLGALAHGLPQVLLPMGADQPHNARRVTALGCGIVLDPVTARPDDVGAAVAGVLAEPSYREAAGRLRDEYATLPPPAAVVPLLEELGRRARP